jgi:hypothetical protein
MRRFRVTLVATLAFGAMALSARADTQQMLGTSTTPSRPSATIIARHYKCGGEELQCDPSLVKVCNPKNRKCCCANAGTDRAASSPGFAVTRLFGRVFKVSIAFSKLPFSIPHRKSLLIPLSVHT